LRPWEPAWQRDALSRAAFARRLRRHAADARDGVGYAFLIFRQADDELLGGITISDIRLGISRSCSVGYWIGKPFARQGHMFSAVVRVAHHVFDGLGMHRLEAACLPHNEPSRALLLKAGFREEGYARQYLCINGKWQDHLLFSLLREDLVPLPEGAAT
jgi:ribosomal-protein-alanine N-acetyltransferase